ncbi:MAG TPA: hypothetical protein VMZ50_08345 [Phycisphaerae bacterium]|nr:hypothetical protein [Phycisphaerae bacterium]
MSDRHDVRVHRPGEEAECSQCGRTVRDRWIEMPHHAAGTVEVKVWCRGCLLESAGCGPGEVTRVRAEDAPDEVLRRGTVTTCPQRMQGVGPWEKKEGLDSWRREDAERFPVDWEPRTCTFCGSLHAGDLLRLIGEDGWTAEWATGKRGYKAYVRAPEGRKTGLSMGKAYNWHLTEAQMRALDAACRRG